MEFVLSSEFKLMRKLQMDLKTEFENQLSEIERELFRKSDTAYYIGYSEFLEQRIEAGQHETIVNFPEPFTAEFLTYLLVNALRHLNEAQRHNLALSLAVRDPLFSIDEYEKQLGN